MCANTKFSMFFFLGSGARIPLRARILNFQCVFCPGLEFPLCAVAEFSMCGVRVGHFFPGLRAAVAGHEKELHDETCNMWGPIHVPKVLAFEWPHDGYVRFSDPVRCACRAFFPGLRAAVASHENFTIHVPKVLALECLRDGYVRFGSNGSCA